MLRMEKKGLRLPPPSPAKEVERLIQSIQCVSDRAMHSGGEASSHLCFTCNTITCTGQSQLFIENLSWWALKVSSIDSKNFQTCLAE